MGTSGLGWIAKTWNIVPTFALKLLEQQVLDLKQIYEPQSGKAADDLSY